MSDLLGSILFLSTWTEPLSCRATQIKTYSWDNAQVILVGNKCDLEDDRLVPTEDGQRLAEELGDDRLTPTFLSSFSTNTFSHSKLYMML